ncbi:Hypothetical predicted protein [Mytilus galloprovincialis]|uniref:HAT C-terminal dimerisation domain-containing protein n=1 Tax=Mytilus galloprovincialis TaxID=29158 RepID=A0A8B6HQI4_MYTGA|nr:Hypothetical predicted protein [Mytilus galloprovincialis]
MVLQICQGFIQARVRERVPLASYVHCKPHNLNLAIVHACKEPLVRNLMDTVQAIAFAFDYSAKRLTSFKENLGTAPNVVKEEMGRRQKLKTLCETRWASRSDSLFTFLHAYSVVCDSLEDLEQDGDAKARSYRCSITKFDFIVGLVVAQAILQPLAPLSAILQTKDFDLIQAVEESKVVVEMLQRKRETDDDWDQLYNSAVTLADSVDVVPSMPRGATRQQHRVNVPAAGPKDYWKRALFIPFIDHLLQELRDRLIKNEDRFVVQYLILSKLENCSLQVVDRLFNTFTEDLPSDRDTFNIEVERWKARWSIAEGQIPGTLAEILNLCNVDLYPNIYTCLLILLTIPVTTATAERSFSVMRRVKTYLRSTMTTDRLSGPCILHAYKETPIDIDKVIDCFATKKDRRLAFLFKATGERE